MYVSGFELTFQSFIVKKSYKISLVFAKMHTMVASEGQKMSKFCML